MHNGKILLHMLQKGTVTSQCYCAGDHQNYIHLYRGAASPEFLSIDNNAGPHKTDKLSLMRAGDDIEHITCHAYSPDLNPIEHVLDALDRTYCSKTGPSSNCAQAL